jgi:hypothetical protein
VLEYKISIQVGEGIMGIKYIHVVLIVVSIILCLGFGFWSLNHYNTVTGYCSFAIAVALIIYLVQFIKRMKAL